ncbi:VC0807 family protein [Wenjunlia tyrosinilytica]|uniref:Intracellular septation protein A n=1 Tax=Wenjunlia tyrosinilytica TaxID=1544741 RepID=A0A918A077_9ACTN|nr:VC0807 family protein [Wenjunlia tyrosinilytica]GGP00802.1 hypothetical protein GCM10012280_70350 [Wenjunlia tyrosinilytica]
MTSGEGRPVNPALKMLFMLVVDLGFPIVIYYVLRSAGVGNILALTVGSLVPATSSVITFARERKVDALGAFVTALMALSIAASLITDSPRFLLVKDGWLTGAAGMGFLATLRGRRPLAFTFSRPLLERQFSDSSGSWDELWERVPRFRRIWRVSTVIWGVGLLIDAAVRAVMAYTLPVDVVPALGGAQYGVFTVLMLVIVNIHQSRAGLWSILRSGAREQGTSEQERAGWRSGSARPPAT